MDATPFRSELYPAIVNCILILYLLSMLAFSLSIKLPLLTIATFKLYFLHNINIYSIFSYKRGSPPDSIISSIMLGSHCFIIYFNRFIF
ncbi:hypothetical protein AC3_A0579 [Clostridium perfringens E str. JGS1987]|uniref:Uncharacterized protein n=1 Tax=Clostridium perfringens E str. JGS1987 TaxID=451755 RepID=B1BSY4_CLOPF|nr:hypothetical protein AC3_A0579 [Clostridium perfringens E str. JGS1987]